MPLNHAKALAIDPDNPRTWIVRGFALHILGRFEEAVESYARAIELSPLGPGQEEGLEQSEACLRQPAPAWRPLGSYEEAIMIDLTQASILECSRSLLISPWPWEAAVVCFRLDRDRS